MRWRVALARRLSRPDSLLANPRFRWLAQHLTDPRLWHVGRRSVCWSAAIGTGFGILIPFGQIPVAATAALLLRVNLPAAVLGTFITNGFTFVPIYVLAYLLGCALTGAAGVTEVATALQSGGLSVALEVIQQLPQPWLTLAMPFGVGVAALAAIVALVFYLGLHGFWIAQVRRAWQRRRTKSDADPQRP